jgi:predicted Zn-dependent peptidase
MHTVLLFAFLVAVASANAQQGFAVVPSDPTHTRLTVLDNGLRVYVSVQRSRPRASTILAVRAGSKDDPANATGLAHYLEHMLFKGTDRLGTWNPKAELPLIDSLEALYETYRHEPSSRKRSDLYNQIDRLANHAAQYALPNEYDRLVAALGCVGTNAFTLADATLYLNNVPVENLEPFFAVEAERLRNPVLRLFPTELDAVYEEKNTSLTSDVEMAYDTILARLFPHHPYGSQSTLGTVEHLRYPSMKSIREFFQRHYVPSNMALVVVGDVQPDSVVAWASRTYGTLLSPPTSSPVKGAPAPFQKQETVTLSGPNTPFVMMGFRWPPARHRDIPALLLLDMILSSSATGCLEQQRLFRGGASATWTDPMLQTDGSVHLIGAEALPGQSLDSLQATLWDCIQTIADGLLSQEQLDAYVLNERVRILERRRSPDMLAHDIAMSFIHGLPWQRAVNMVEELSRITVDDVVRVAREYYSVGHCTIVKNQGTRTDSMELERPVASQLPQARTAWSDFAIGILKRRAMPGKSVIDDIHRDVTISAPSKGVTLYSAINTTDELFSCTIIVQRGWLHSPLLSNVVECLHRQDTETMIASTFSGYLESIGAAINAECHEDKTVITLHGLHRTAKEAFQLLADRLLLTVFRQQPWQRYVDNVEATIDANMLDLDVVHDALREFALYGKKSAYLIRPTIDELRYTSQDTLSHYLRLLLATEHSVLYYGPADTAQVADLLRPLYVGAGIPQKAPPRTVRACTTLKKPVLYAVDWPGNQSRLFAANVLSEPVRRSNTGRMEWLSAVTTSEHYQRLREQSGLAYTALGTIVVPADSSRPYAVESDVATSAEQTSDALRMVVGIHTSQLVDSVSALAQKDMVTSALGSDVPTHDDVVSTVWLERHHGWTSSRSNAAFRQLQGETLASLGAAKRRIAADPIDIVAVLGPKRHLKSLSWFAPIRWLRVQDIIRR